MKFNPLNGMPNWCREDRNTTGLSKHSLRSIRYYRKLYIASPKWYTMEMHQKILNIYKECERRRALGEKVCVDHIIPVCSDEVCGLNVPWNLQIITEEENLRKSNLFWPDKWIDQIPLPIPQLQPYQQRLL